MASSIPPASDRSQSHGASPDEMLPPVEPPTAQFFIQLFVTPAIIVAGVVLVWFLIESMARRGEQDPDAIVAALRSSNQARFQRAKDLADMLRLPERYPELKTNRELAGKLAEYLDELVEAADPSDAAVAMRIVVARALGDFNVADGLPALVNAALKDPERDVRRQAVNAIAVLTGSMAALGEPLASDEHAQALVQLAADEDELVRSESAFALGVAAAQPDADPRLVETLEALADDPYTDARFNAAVWLARTGSPRAAAAVAELLDPEAIEASVSGEKPLAEDVSQRSLEATRSFKRKVLITGGLKAAGEVLDRPAISAEDVQALRQALERFIAALPEMGFPEKVQAELTAAAERTLKKANLPAAGPPSP